MVQMTKDDLAKVFEVLPFLNPHGVCLDRDTSKLPVIERAARLERDQQFMLTQLDLMSRVCDFLSANFRPIKAINKMRSSYGLKHLVSDAIGEYMSNGIFIAAAVQCGFLFRTNDGPNVHFGISMKSIRIVEKSHNYY